MTWFVIFAVTVFAVYFWRQHRAREREMNSPLASHRSGPQPHRPGRRARAGPPERHRADPPGQSRLAIRGPNLPAGAKARVTGVDGTVLLVDRVAASIPPLSC